MSYGIGRMNQPRERRVDEASIIQYVTKTFSGVNVVRPQPGDVPEIAVGDTFFIYDPGRDLEPRRQFPFATLVTKDYGDFDRASNLDRPGVFRLNIGIGRETFRALFGDAGDAGHDFSTLDRLMPHPVYAAQAWVCILNPTPPTFASAVRPLLAEAYERAVRRVSGRQAAAEEG